MEHQIEPEVTEETTDTAATADEVKKIDTSQLIPYTAYAKINLCLEVLGKRPDRYHAIASVMQTISLADQVYVGLSDDLEFDCNDPELVTEDNLVWRAANYLHNYCPDKGATIYLEKNIPSAAGLGGGSSDAATTLKALNQLWELDFSTSHLEELAANLGSDVPFFIRGGTLLSEGRGERLSYLPPFKKMWVILVLPDLRLPPEKTAEFYRMLDQRDYTNGAIVRQLVKAIENNEEPAPSLFYNVFEQVVYRSFPPLDGYRQAIVDAGGHHVRISGSGPTLYTLVNSEEEGQHILDKLLADDLTAFLAHTITP
jgi:4-diphosphocytidyl-2-C-methyl-D-erythritol kinase